MSIYKKGTTWFTDWRDQHGIRHRKSHPDKATAHRLHRRIHNWKKGKGRKPHGLNLSDLARNYLATLHDRTYGYRSTVTRVLHWLTATTTRIQPSKLEPQHLKAFLEKVGSYPLTSRQMYQYIAKRFLGWCHDNHEINYTPRELVSAKYSTPVRRRITLEPQTVALLLANANPVQQLLLMLGYHAGLRISEIRRAEVRDWNHAARTLRVATSKNGPHRQIPADQHLANYLNQLCAANPPEATLVTCARGRPLRAAAISKAWRSLMDTTGLSGYRPHDLRRTWATELAAVSGPATLMELMGWTDIRTAIHYHVPRVRDRAQAIELLALMRREENNPPPEGTIQ